MMSSSEEINDSVSIEAIIRVLRHVGHQTWTLHDLSRPCASIPILTREEVK